MSVLTEQGVDGSTLELYRSALRARRESTALGEGPLLWLADAPAGVLAFSREDAGGASLVCALNLETTTAVLPAAWGSSVVIATSDDVAEVAAGDDEADAATTVVIGGETAVWLRA